MVEGGDGSGGLRDSDIKLVRPYLYLLCYTETFLLPFIVVVCYTHFDCLFAFVGCCLICLIVWEMLFGGETDSR